MTVAELVVDQGAEIREEALSWPARARGLIVRDSPSYQEAGGLLKGIKALRQKIADTFDPHIRRAFDSHKALLKEKQDFEAPLAEAESILKRGLVAYDQEQERLRQEEERRRQEEARKAEEDRRLAEAAALEREGNATENQELLDEAQQLMEAPIVTPAVIVEKSTPKISGIVYRESWKYRVADLNKVPREYLKLDDIKVGQIVRAMKGATNIPGIQAYAENIVAAGSR